MNTNDMIGLIQKMAQVIRRDAKMCESTAHILELADTVDENPEDFATFIEAVRKDNLHQLAG